MQEITSYQSVTDEHKNVLALGVTELYSTELDKIIE